MKVTTDMWPLRGARIPVDQDELIERYLKERGLTFTQLFDLMAGTFFTKSGMEWPWRYEFLRTLVPQSTEPTDTSQAS